MYFAEKPKLWLDGIIGRKIKVRAGEPINIDIPLSGAPTPKIEWAKNGVNIPESNRVSVSVNLYASHNTSHFSSLSPYSLKPPASARSFVWSIPHATTPESTR